MKVSEEGVALIKKYEGCRLHAYKAVPTEKYYTIGWGHYSEWVKPDMTITQEQADALLMDDLAKFEQHVNIYNNKYHFTQNQFDALVSFAFNVGSITQLTQKGTRTIRQISASIPKYVKSGGKVLPGLVRRRIDEQKLFDRVCKVVLKGGTNAEKE